MHMKFQWEKLKERGCLEDTDWRIISLWEGVVWIHLAQDVDHL